MKVEHAAIIAGGASRRMGQTKALIEVEGRPLIAHIAEVLRPRFAQIVAVTADTNITRAADLPSISDAFPGRGPLGGIHAALMHFQVPVFCCACDMPHLNAVFIAHLCAQLVGFDAVLPRVQGFAEPLHAVYTARCLPAIEAALQSERTGSVERVLASMNVRWIEEAEARRFDADLRMFDNWNTPEQVGA